MGIEPGLTKCKTSILLTHCSSAPNFMFFKLTLSPAVNEAFLLFFPTINEAGFIFPYSSLYFTLF